MSSFHKRSTCRLCESTNLTPVLNLTPTPPANAFVSGEHVKKGLKEERFPLDVHFCETCFHVQLLDIVDPKILFSHYVYVSGTSPSFVEHFRKYSDTVKALLKPGGDKPLVVEIGSNDGTLLKFFDQKDFKVLGIDPAENLAQKANAENIPTWCDFFNETVSEKIKKELGQASVVMANNVFAHIDDLKSVALGVKNVLAPQGFFVFEVSYLADVYKSTLFDTIYHEHLSYHSVAPLKTFFEKLGLELFDVQRLPTHGGSLRGFVQLKGAKRSVTPSVSRFIEDDKNLGLYKANTFVNFGRKIEKLKSELNALLKEYKAKGKTIAGYGAPAKATTLMFHFGLDQETMNYIVDENPLKQGLFSPGLHVPVVSPQELQKNPADILVILAWNFAESIISRHKAFLNDGGTFVVPVPEVKTFTKDSL